MGSLSGTRSKIGREEIKWQELLLHFRSVQSKHEKARRQALGTDAFSSGLSDSDWNEERDSRPGRSSGSGSGTRPAVRRKVTGEINVGAPGATAVAPGPLSARSGILSPLNPRARGQSGLLASAVIAQTGTGPGTGTGAASAIPLLAQQTQKQRRTTMGLGRKS